MEYFTPVSAFIGGLLIGLSAALLLLFNGRIAGVSGILSGVFIQPAGDRLWRMMFIVGMVVAALLYQLAFPGSFVARENFPLSMLIIGSFIVGFGTRMGGGCTSGHGVCGIGRISSRSITATFIFMAAGIVTTYVVRHVFGFVS